MMDTAPERAADLVRAGRKIEAVKVVREETGASLKDALRAVEEMEAAASGDDPLREAEALVREGKPLDAIRVLRDGAGLGLKEAKDVVEAMPRPPEAHAPRGVAVAALALLLLLGAILVFAVMG